MISEKQKQIYNFYLRAYRINNGKPYKAKQKFDDLKKKEKVLIALHKLEQFFNKFPHLQRHEFFDAPYKIYGDERKYYDLPFYASHKGLTTCVAYFNMRKESDPDKQLDSIRESLKFILDFCVEKNLLLSEYPAYKSVAQYDSFKHIKEHRISWFVVAGFPDLFRELLELPNDEFELYFGSTNLSDVLKLYENSTEAKRITTEGLKRINAFLLNKKYKIS